MSRLVRSGGRGARRVPTVGLTCLRALHIAAFSAYVLLGMSGCAGSMPSRSAATTSTTAAALDMPLDDGQIATIVSDIDMARLSIAKIATSRASTAQVRAFATRMASEHAASEERLNDTMKAGSIAPAASPLGNELTYLSRAQELTLLARSGSDFDSNYVAAQCLAYLYVLSVFDEQLLPRVTNARLRSDLAATRSQLASQKKAADDLWKTLEPTSGGYAQ
jgi:putative membrane protein